MDLGHQLTTLIRKVVFHNLLQTLAKLPAAWRNVDTYCTIRVHTILVCSWLHIHTINVCVNSSKANNHTHYMHYIMYTVYRVLKENGTSRLLPNRGSK